MENVVIIGSGPAGLTAALYAARANLSPVLITGNEFGGQVAITADVENYPGFPEVVTGPELVEKMRAQAERFGARYDYDEVTAVDFSGWPHTVKTHSNEYQTKTVIVATGASPKRLEVPGDRELTGKGVSYCATCDGFFFRGKELVVVGGGDSAVEEGLFLTKFATKVRLIHRRDTLRAGSLLQQRAFSNPKMEFIWDTVVNSVNGNGSVHSVSLENLKTGEQRELETSGVFVYVGHYPNSGLFQGLLEMDEHGYLLADHRKRTNIPGVFAAGEIADPIYRQVVTSAGEGCKAAMQVEKWLAEREGRPEPGGPGPSLASW
jgi:thioredoxin reductase (NADPH)